MRSERRKRLSLALISKLRRSARAGLIGVPTFCNAFWFERLTNPMTASSDTLISNPAARARSRQASILESSATAAAMASDSSRAKRFTTSSIQNLLSAAGAGIPGHLPSDMLPPGPGQDSGDNFVHMKDLKLGN